MAKSSVPTVALGGVLYRLPFAELFRPHTPAERERLSASVAAHGVRIRVLTYTSPTLGRRCVVDGGTRLSIAAERGRSVPVTDLGHLDDCAARELAVTINADRRHLSVEEQAAARAERVVKAAALAEAGKSFRAIGAETGVSHEQARQDVAAAKAARQPAAEPAAAPATPPEPTPERHLEAARRGVCRLREAAERLAAGPWAEHLRRALERHRVGLPTIGDLDAALADLAALAAVGFDPE